MCRHHGFEFIHHRHDFVNADTAHVTGHAALEATDRVINLFGFLGFPRRDEALPHDLILGAQTARLLAVRAQRAHQPLRHHPEHGGLQQIGWHAEIQ